MLNIPANTTPSTFDQDSGLSTTGVESQTAFAFDFFASPEAVAAGQNFIVEFLSNTFRANISGSSGTLYLRHGERSDAGGGTTYSTPWESDTSLLQSRVKVLVLHDAALGDNGQMRYIVNGTEVHVADIPADHTFRNQSGLIFKFYGNDTGDVELYSVYEFAGHLPPQADIDAWFNDGTPFPTADAYCIPSGDGYSASIAFDTGAYTLDHANPIAGETDEGSANAPYLTVDGVVAPSTGWISPPFPNLSAGDTVSVEVRTRDRNTVILAKTDFTLDGNKRLTIPDGLGAEGDLITLLFWTPAGGTVFGDSVVGGV